jgi:hypothetical protein
MISILEREQKMPLSALAIVGNYGKTVTLFLAVLFLSIFSTQDRFCCFCMCLT